MPYLLGTERQKGSHSMAGYHSFELAYLAAVYTNLLITKEPMDLCFSPIPGALPDNILRVSPDILPPGSIKIGEVEVDGKPYADFDADALTVKVPKGEKRAQDQVRVVPTIDPFEVTTQMDGDVAEMTLSGKLDTSTYARFQAEVEKVLAKKPGRLVLYVEGPRLDRQRGDPGAAVRSPADGYLGSRGHLRGRPELGRPRGLPCRPRPDDINVVGSYEPFRDPTGSARARTDPPPAPAGGAGRRALRQAPAGTCSRPSSARRTSRNASVTPGMAGRDEVAVDDRGRELIAVVDEGAPADSTSPMMLWAQVTRRPISVSGAAQNNHSEWQIVPILIVPSSIAATDPAGTRRRVPYSARPSGDAPGTAGGPSRSRR